MTTKTILVYDTTSLLYANYYAHQKTPDEMLVAGLAMSSALNTFLSHYRKHKPDYIFAAFDRPSWRKKLTKVDDNFDFVYKGHRRQDMTPAQREKFEAFIEHIQKFEEVLKDKTSIVSLAAEGLEGDDLVAAVAQKFGKDHKVICITGDSDLAQLQTENVSVIYTRTGKPFNLKKWDNDPEYYLFNKCIRGDKQSDNIPSALPRVRENVIRKAYDDPLSYENLMEQKFTIADKEYKVRDRYAQNRLLIDLQSQPPSMRKLMDDTVTTALKENSTYSHFHFGKYCKALGLERICENQMQYAEMLALPTTGILEGAVPLI